MTGQLYEASSHAERRTMKRDPIAVEAPELQDVLDALDDPDCRAILGQLDSPMAAKELSEACEIPQSTTYRKLDLLSDASLVDERTEIRDDGRHTTRYVADFEEIQVSLDEDGSLELAIGRRESTPEERLSALWSEVRTET
jgi:DNA-binding transcriptional ArsR family regulator